MNNEVIDWYLSRTKGHVQRVIHNLHVNRRTPEKYAGKNLLGISEGSNAIYEMLTSDYPCMICRYGSTELDVMSASMAYPKINKKALIDREQKGFIYSSAGFFPRGIEYLVEFGKLMQECSRTADYIGVWFIPMEDYVIRKCASSETRIGLLRSIEPWYATKKKWTEALEGKKVLVIHPFAETIRSQYKKRDHLFDDSHTLPEFELFTLQAVQTIAGQKDDRFETWFDALQFMYEQALTINFDIAILGCGAYGFPLAAMLKKAGKKAVHMGGATQLLFGIKGNRWDNHPVISKLYNEYWVRPGDNEKPLNANEVENGCYW